MPRTKQPPFIDITKTLLSRPWTATALALHLGTKDDTARRYLVEAEQGGWMKVSVQARQPGDGKGGAPFLYTPLFKLEKLSAPHQDTA